MYAFADELGWGEHHAYVYAGCGGGEEGGGGLGGGCRVGVCAAVRRRRREMDLGFGLCGFWSLFLLSFLFWGIRSGLERLYSNFYMLGIEESVDFWNFSLFLWEYIDLL